LRRLSRFMLAVLVSLLVVIAGLVHALKQHPPYAPQINAEKQAHGTLKGDENAKRGTESRAKANEEHGRKHSEQGENEGTEFWPPFLGLRLKITDSLLAAFTFGLLIFTGLLWRSTDKLWIASEKQLVTIQRAFVFPREIDAQATFNRLTGEYVRCRISKRWENSGTTPAVNVAMRENVGVFAGDIPENFSFPDHPDNPTETIVLAPKGDILGRGLFIPPNDIHSTMRGETRLFIWGWVEYDDVFEGSRRHRTEFCNELITDGFEVPIERREITSRVYGRHNGYDDHCHNPLQTPRV
jgi:hypothetical protein